MGEYPTPAWTVVTTAPLVGCGVEPAFNVPRESEVGGWNRSDRFLGMGMSGDGAGVSASDGRDTVTTGARLVLAAAAGRPACCLACASVDRVTLAVGPVWFGIGAVSRPRLSPPAGVFPRGSSRVRPTCPCPGMGGTRRCSSAEGGGVVCRRRSNKYVTCD